MTSHPTPGHPAGRREHPMRSRRAGSPRTGRAAAQTDRGGTPHQARRPSRPMLRAGHARRARPFRYLDELTHADAGLRGAPAPECARPRDHVATQHAGELLGRDGNAWAAADWCPPAAAITAPAVGQFVRPARVKPATYWLQ